MMNGLQPYPAYKESGVPWLGEIPSHWEVLPNRAVFFEVNQRNFPDEQLLSVTIAQGVIKQSDLLKGSTKKDSSNEDKTKYKLVKPGDIVYNKMRAWQSAIGLSKERGIVSPAYLVIHLRDNKDEPKYFHYLFRIPNFAKEAERWSYGITSDQWSLRIEDFKQIYVSIPSKFEQINIVKTLNFFDKQIFDLIIRKKRLIKLLLEQKKAIIHQAVTRGLDPSVPMKPSGTEYVPKIPENWEIKRLKFITVTHSSGIQMGPFGSMLTNIESNKTGFKVYGQENTIKGDFEIGGRWLTEKQFANLCKYEITEGDLILTRKGSIGHCQIVPKGISTGIADSDTIRVRPDYQIIFDQFLVRILHEALYLQEQLVSIKRGAIIAGLNTSTIANLKIILPSIDEQKSIERYLKSKCSEIDEIIENIKQNITLSLEYRTRLITDVVTGKLDVRHLAASLPDLEEVPLDEPLEEEPEEEFADEEE